VTFPIPVCATCGRAVFPPRVLCPQCGGREWRDEPVDGGVVERSTERDGTAIATVRTPLGPVLVARLLGDAAAGDAVVLDADGAVPVARP
jgi:uncharacterized OB-fold protein